MKVLESDWCVYQWEEDPLVCRKFESILCQGNGYLGVRAATEEDGEKTVRYTLVAGTFDRMRSKNTNELPNAADTTALTIRADGIELALTPENHSDHCRWLDLRNGLLHRSFRWMPRTGLTLEVVTERFVSLAQRHVLAQRAWIKVLEGSCELELVSGIRGGKRYGEEHFLDMESHLSGQLLQYAETTRQSGITFVTGCYVDVKKLSPDGAAQHIPTQIQQGADRIARSCTVTVEAGQQLELTKLCRIATTRDNDFSCRDDWERDALIRREREQMDQLYRQGYDAIRRQTCEAWEALWAEKDVLLEGNAEARLACRFAVYHLTVMAPVHDNRMNIGAKGLSGKGYFGHTFWDTEIYMLPFFIWTDPKAARSLLEYRYHCLDAARENARRYGFRGARFPWEAAWLTDGDVCPEDHFAKHEYHVTADVAYGVYHYYQATHDMDFMLRCGCELLFETANFWASRLDYNEEKDCYELLDVIGPDEFTHQANNNAFTNYLAHMNLEQACFWCRRLEEYFPAEYKRLNAGIRLQRQLWQQMADKLVLPKAGEDKILPQDDDFMTLPEIDLTIYRAGIKKLRKDYPYPTYTRLKVSKQADVMNLFLLREDLFPQEVKEASLAYYEPFCVHESSLSLCAYAMLAADCGREEQAYGFFRRACRIDLGPDLKSSDEGIHAASLGGIWQCCVLGYAGVRLCGDRLRIAPNLPESWQSVTAKIWWRGSQLEVTATHTDVTVRVVRGPAAMEVLTCHGILKGENVLSWQLHT